MTSFTFSAPAAGFSPAFQITVEAFLSTITQPDVLGNDQTVQAYVLTSASGNVSGDPVSLYTGGIPILGDVRNSNETPTIIFNNAIKVSGLGDLGSTTLHGIDNFGLLFKSGANFYHLYYDGTSFELEKSTTGSFLGSFSYAPTDITSNAPCYCRGTTIATPSGPVAIERLAVGDLVLTASGAARPIRWIGWREVDAVRHPNPQAVWPYRILAHAFGPGLPARDLWISPAHCVAIEDRLIPIELLANGATIRQVKTEAVEYWHVELDSHDVILAEGLPAESYLDNGNRTHFANGGDFVEAHPTFRPQRFRDTCLPYTDAGPALEAAKAHLLARASNFGFHGTSDADLHVVADGERFEPVPLGGQSFAFLLPPDRREIALRSRAFVPAQMNPASADRRRLGLAVARLQLDGQDLPLWRDALFNQGWHRLESDQPTPFRWTNGDSRLPAGLRLIVLTVQGIGVYWQPRPAPLKLVASS